jgi:hypothetical protein
MAQRWLNSSGQRIILTEGPNNGKRMLSDECCCPTCAGLSSCIQKPTLGKEFEVVISGVANGTCSQCNVINGTFIVSQTTNGTTCCGDWIDDFGTSNSCTSGFLRARAFIGNQNSTSCDPTKWVIEFSLLPIPELVLGQLHCYMWRETGLTARDKIIDLCQGLQVSIPWLNQMNISSFGCGGSVGSSSSPLRCDGTASTCLISIV